MKKLSLPPLVLRHFSFAVRLRLSLTTVGMTGLQISACLLLAAAINGVFLGDWDLAATAPVLLALFGVLAGQAGLALYQKRLLRQLSLSLRQDIRQQLHHACLEPQTAIKDSQRLLTLALETTDALDGAVMQVLPNLAQFVCSTPCLLIALWLLDWPTGLLALVTLPIAPLLLWLIGSVTQKRSAAAWQELATLSASFGELLACLPTLKLFGQVARQGERLHALSQRFSTASLAVLQVAFLSTFALELITTLAIALLAVSIGLRLLYGQLDFLTAFTVLLLAPIFYQPLRSAGASFHAAMTARTAWQKLAPCLAAADTPAPHSHHAQLRIPPAIHLQNLRYRYPDTTNNALDLTTASWSPNHTPNSPLSTLNTTNDSPNASLSPLTIPASQITVVTGPSGCGKSTLCRLLAGLAQPSDGTILFEDQPLVTMDAASRAKILSYVPQEPHLYAATLRENLTLNFGDGDSTHFCASQSSFKSGSMLKLLTLNSQLSQSVSDEHCLSALNQAALTNWYRFLPQGLDTPLGPGGLTLSQGERHRLGLARALLQARPVVILDEPTAGLDAATEQTILQTLKNFSYHRTLIIISHRPAVLALADNVLTLAPPITTAATNSADTATASPNPSQLPTLNSQLPPTAAHFCASLRSFKSGSLLTTLNSQLFTLISFPSLLLLLAVSLLALATGLGLLGAAAWLIATAALQPPLYAHTLGITAVRACGLGRAAARYAERYYTHRTAFRIQTRLHMFLYKKASALLPLRSGLAAQGAFLHDLLTGSADLRDFYLRALLPPLTLGLATILFTALLWPHIGALALLLPACCLLHLLLPYAIIRKSSSSDDNLTKRFAHFCASQSSCKSGSLLKLSTLNSQLSSPIRSAESLYRTTLADCHAGRDELTLAGTTATAMGRLNQCAQNWQQQRAHADTRQDLTDTLLSLTAHATLLLLTATLIPCVTAAPASATMITPLSGVGLAVWLLLLLTLLDNYNLLPTAARQAKIARTAAKNILPPVEDNFPHSGASQSSCKSASQLTTPNSSLPTLLNVRSLTFGHTPAQPLLRDLSFTIAPGQHTALVGESGAGKTTLAQLLAGVWPPDSGTIEHHGAITVIPQGCQLFNASIHDNFRALYPDIEDKKILAALQDAQFEVNGVTTPSVSASQLSGGQRSRLLTALTIASDTPLLILDEPTAGLDTATTQRLLAALFARVERTHQALLIITHDPLPLSYCEQVIKLG